MRVDQGTKASMTVLVCAGLAFSSTGWGFQPTGWDWTWQGNQVTVPFQTNVNSFPASAGTSSEIQDALVDAMNVWNNEGDAEFTFTRTGNTNHTAIIGDTSRRIQYVQETANGGTIAVAQSYIVNGLLTDCDISFYTANGYGPISWSARASGASWSEIDMGIVAIHELGHCAGLDHSALPEAVMAPSVSAGTGPNERHLSEDDAAGLQAIYGVAVGGDMELQAMSPIAPGATVQMLVTGADPGERVHLLASLQGLGTDACPPPLHGACLDIAGPVTRVAQTTADAHGSAVVQLTLPIGVSGSDLAFQAVTRRGFTANDVLMSNTVTGATSSGPTCAAGLVPDCNGTCYQADWVGDGYCDDSTTYPWGSPDFMCSQYQFDFGDCAP